MYGSTSKGTERTLVQNRSYLSLYLALIELEIAVYPEHEYWEENCNNSIASHFCEKSFKFFGLKNSDLKRDMEVDQI